MTPCIGCMHAALLNKSLRYRSREPDKSCRVTWDPIWFSGSDGNVGALKCYEYFMPYVCFMSQTRSDTKLQGQSLSLHVTTK